MAVNNRLAVRAQQKPIPDKAVEYRCGDEIVKLSPSIIRNYLVNGDGAVSDQEVAMFLNLCRYQHLNPFLREAYLIKYGSKPATIVTGKDAIIKRAVRNPRFEGMEAGVVIMHPITSDEDIIEYRSGALVLEGEVLVGGWAKVYIKDYTVPMEAVASYNEYVGRKSDGTINAQWSTKPATMIRKVALVQAMREAFPEDLEGMYASEEMGVDINEETMPTQPVSVETVPDTPPVEPDNTIIDDAEGGINDVFI